MFTLQDGSPRNCLPKATSLFVESLEPCVKHQLISSHQLAEHWKQCYTQNSERLLGTLNEKDESRKTARSRKGALSVDRCAEDWVVPFRGVTSTGRVKLKGPEDEVWSLADWLRNTEQRVQNRTAGDWELIYVYWPWLWQPDLVHVLVGETPFEKNSQDRGASVVCLGLQYFLVHMAVL